MKRFYSFTPKFALTLILSLFYTVTLFAQTIKGNVTDAKTSQTLIGATVHLEKPGVQRNTSVKLDGDYIFKNVPAGTYKLRVSYLGYKTTKNYDVDAVAGQTTTLNIAMVDDQTAMKEVVISEHASKETDRSARADEKNSDNTINVVSANSIAISPDQIVSNVLARVSGISVDRGNSGDAQHAIIRGMDKQYNTTLINGVKIPSPDNKDRYVPLDIFPADLVQSIEVFKTLTPDMEADASGGVVNMVMKTAPDHLRVDGYFGTGYSQLFLDRPFYSFNSSTINAKAPGEINPGQPASVSDFPYQNLITHSGYPPPNAEAALTIGNRYFDKKLGVVFSGSFQNLYQGNNTFAVVQENTVGPSPNINTPNQETSFQNSYNRQYSSHLTRAGAIASIDYKFNDNNMINLFATYLQLDDQRVRNTQSYVYENYSYNGYVGTNERDNYTETRTDLQSIFNATLKGKHKVTKAFLFDWTLAASEAVHKQPDIAEFETQQETSPDTVPAHGYHQVPDPNNPHSSLSVTPDIINGPVLVGNESRVWTHNTDKDLSGYLNMHYNLKLFNRWLDFSAGGMFRHKTRDNFVDSYNLPNTFVPGTDTAEHYTTIPAAQFTFSQKPYNAYGSSSTDPGVYTFTENIQAVYGMAKYYVSNKLDLVFGLRAENTNQNYDSNLPSYLAGKTGAISYTDYLPSINAKYALTDNQAIRASYFVSILRPAFADFIPYPDQTVDDPYATVGNPYLQHTVIDNYDLRYEFFPGVFDSFLAGVFYKHLINPIETMLLPGSQGATLFLEPQNLGNAQNYGFELDARKFFGNIGFALNYTYTQSQITTEKSIDVQNVGVAQRLETRPLQGQADNIGNFSVLYKDQRNGIDAQVALAYTGPRIQAVSEYYDLDTWEKATVGLDFSAQKKIGKRFILFVKVNNILNTPYELYIRQNNSMNYTGLMKYPHQESPSYTTVEYDQYFARYNLGCRFNFD